MARLIVRVSLFASEQQYIAHAGPAWNALPPDLRGEAFIATYREAHVSKPAAELVGGFMTCKQRPPRDSTSPVIVASYTDLQSVTLHTDRPVCLVEHGAGQRYVGMESNPAYPGGAGRDSVGLFVCPSEMVAEANRTRYPTAQYAVVGDPSLDRWLPVQPRPERDRPVVAFAWHWRAGRLPQEAWSAFGHYKSSLRRIAPEMHDRGWDVIGTAHPRMWPFVKGVYAVAGIRCVPAQADVFDLRPDVLIADNTSMAWQAAALGIPLVWLNRPEYREPPLHPPPWEWRNTTGPIVREPSELVRAVARLLECDYASESREAAVSKLYAYRDGRASERAADAVVRWLSTI